MTRTPETAADARADARPERLADGRPVVEVRRRVSLSAGIGAAAAALAIGYFVRASAGGSWLDWLVCLVMTLVAAAHLQALLDARAPLLVVDSSGVRVRRGRTWRGVGWPEVERVEVRPRTGWLRDGGVRVAALAEPRLEVPLSLSTRVVGAGDDLAAAVARFAGPVPVVAPAGAGSDADEPPTDQQPAAEPATAEPADRFPVRAPATGDDQAAAGTPAPAPRPDDRAAPPSPSPSPLRRLRLAMRSEAVLPAAAAPRRRDPGDEPPAAAGHADPDATAAWRLSDDPQLRRIADPVIGPRLVAARERLGLSVDQLAERTRIRPHVIEAIEVDDFEPCGGNFYARGHLRTLARVLGLDSTPLLATYDESYADAPVDPRRVFEAELATASGRSLRGTRGVNWSVLVAAVMAVVLVWSVARLLTDGPVGVSDGLRLNNSGGIDQSARRSPAGKVPVRLTAEGGGAKVLVRDGSGRVVFDDELAFGQSVDLDVVAPIRVSSTDGSLRVAVDGDDRGPLGATGQAAQNTFIVR